MNTYFEKDISIPQCVASTTKLMAALVAIDLITDMNQTATVAYEDLVEANESRVNFSVGDVVNYRDLLHGLLIPSGNDAANCLARSLGGKSQFVSLMNAKAAGLGLNSTFFDDPSGISYLTVSTAYELSLIMQEFIKDDRLVEISSKMDYVVAITGTNQRDIPITHTVKFIISEFPELICAKTGTVSFGSGYAQYNSGGCIVVYWKMVTGEKRISVVLGSGYGSNDRYDDLRKMIDYETSRHSRYIH